MFVAPPMGQAQKVLVNTFLVLVRRRPPSLVTIGQTVNASEPIIAKPRPLRGPFGCRRPCFSSDHARL